MGKVTAACNACAVRKIKCNGSKPCPACIKSGFDCTYSVHSKRGPKGPRPATRAKIDRTQQLVQEANEPYAGHGPARSADPPATAYHGSPGSTCISVDSLGHHPVRRPSFSSERSSSYAISQRGSTELSGNTVGDSSVTLDEIAAYLQVYHTFLYPVWPVVDHIAVLRKLRFEPRDAENCTLAFALCAAVTGRLRIDNPNDAPNTASELVTSRRFAELAESHRATYNYRAQASIVSILIPFFLHVHYDCQYRVFMDSVLLREAISVAQLMNLDKIGGYVDLSIKDQVARRKVFWLLFISEKGCAMMRDFPTSLQPSLPLPDPSDEPNPNLVIAFVSLVGLFAAVFYSFGGNGGGLLNGTQGLDKQYSSAFFVDLQDQLGRQPQLGPMTHEVQRADILLTQQWLQVLVWRFSVSHVNMSPGDHKEALSITFPAKVARRTLECLEQLPFEAVVAHGRGMEQKVFEIACTLLDIINVIPAASLNTTSGPASSSSATFGFHGPDIERTHHTSQFQQSDDEPITLLRSLSSILSIIGGRHSPYVGLLQKKIAETQASYPPRILEMRVVPEPAPQSMAGSPRLLHDAALLRDFWVDSRAPNRGVWTDHATIVAAKEAAAAGYSSMAQQRQGQVQSPSIQVSQPQKAYTYSSRPFERSSGHWPIGTEILGTISEVGYLNGWRGGAQVQGPGSGDPNAGDIGGMT